MATPIALRSPLAEDQLHVEDRLRELLPDSSTSVGRAMGYAVLGGGQRLRPVLGLRVARVVENPDPMVLECACAVELLHCASLIVDDLPCMDNDAVRRNRPSLHVEFGEATAVLAAFGLVSLAARAAAGQPCFQMKLLSTLDCNSLIGGQALDLELSGRGREEDRGRVTSLKTVPLFRLGVEAGLGHAVPVRERDRLLDFGCRFGIAYQMADDYVDGEAPDADAVTRALDAALGCIEPLDGRARDLDDLLETLHAKVREHRRRHR